MVQFSCQSIWFSTSCFSSGNEVNWNQYCADVWHTCQVGASVSNGTERDFQLNITKTRTNESVLIARTMRPFHATLMFHVSILKQLQLSFGKSLWKLVDAAVNWDISLRCSNRLLPKSWRRCEHRLKSMCNPLFAACIRRMRTPLCRKPRLSSACSN